MRGAFWTLLACKPKAGSKEGKRSGVATNPIPLPTSPLKGEGPTDRSGVQSAQNSSASSSINTFDPARAERIALAVSGSSFAK